MFDLILVGVDSSDSSRRALDWAAAQAVVCDAHLEVVSCAEVPWVGRQPVTVGTVREVEEHTAAEVAAALTAVRAAHPGLGGQRGHVGRATRVGP